MIKTWTSYKKFSVLSYLALSLVLTGCKLPELDSEDPNALVEISEQDIERAMQPETDKITLDSFKVNQYVKYVATFRTEISQKLELYYIKERQVKAVKLINDPAIIAMDYVFQMFMGNKDSFSGDEIWQISNPQVNVNEYSAFAASDDDPVISFKYYNLKTSRRTVRPPDAVMERPNCGGLADCNIQGIDVRYIRHVLFDGVVKYRQEVSRLVSGEIPALFLINNPHPGYTNYPVFEECYRYILEGTYVKECMYLEDLDKNP